MSEEREFAHAEWRQIFFDRTSREPTPSEAWYAALKWQAARQSAGATGQEPVATLHDDGHWTWKKGIPPHESNYAGWRMDVYAAPIGDNGAKARPHPFALSAKESAETAVAHAFGGRPVDPCDCVACVKMRGHQYGEASSQLAESDNGVKDFCSEDCTCSRDFGHRVCAPSQPAESKREDFEADAKRLALELECLLLSCKDQAAVSKWWDSAMDALEQHRVLLARSSAKGE